MPACWVSSLCQLCLPFLLVPWGLCRSLLSPWVPTGQVHPTALEQETWKSCRAGTLRFPLPSWGQPTPHPANSFPPFQSSPSLIAQCRSALASPGEAAIGPDARGVCLLQKHPPTGLLPSRKAEPGSRKRLLLPVPRAPACCVAIGNLLHAPPGWGVALNSISKKKL